MKPLLSHVAIVTASVDPQQALPCFQSWMAQATYHLPVYVVYSLLPGLEEQQRLDVFDPGATWILRSGGGVVPAFAQGVQAAFEDGADAVMCLHDDLLIEDQGWDVQVLHALEAGTRYAGFGGGTTLGAADIYQTPYDPMQLARGGFVSNMRHAEAHGRRSTVPVPCVVFDGFSAIGTKDWFPQAWQWLAESGVLHHFYDGILGCLAARAGVQPGLMIPVRCQHFGGRTAVANAAYQDWAKAQVAGGDQTFWEQAHRIGYESFRDMLPLRLVQPSLRRRMS